MAANALEFYATSAAILPVFYLTLAVEPRIAAAASRSRAAFEWLLFR